MQSRAEERGSIPGPDKAEFGRLTWSGLIGSLLSGGRTRQREFVSKPRGLGIRVATMRLGEGVSFSGSPDPSGLPRDRA